MKSRLTPATVMTGLVLAGLLACAILIQAAINRPWLGIAFTADDAGVVRAMARPGGTAQLSGGPGRIVALQSHDGQAASVASGDLIEEPDTLATYTEMKDFFVRQSALQAVLNGKTVMVEIQDDKGATRTSTFSPSSRRPIGDLPATFWVQLVVGLSSFLIGGWVWHCAATIRRPACSRWPASASLALPFPQRSTAPANWPSTGNCFARFRS